ncbi:MAG: hypothetical protein GPI90_00750 [Microcystis aeruginosa K13-05]|nr:hypothetical protein [Microcystis aeruginosa K13-05]
MLDKVFKLFFPQKVPTIGVNPTPHTPHPTPCPHEKLFQQTLNISPPSLPFLGRVFFG